MKVQPKNTNYDRLFLLPWRSQCYFETKLIVVVAVPEMSYWSMTHKKASELKQSFRVLLNKVSQQFKVKSCFESLLLLVSWWMLFFNFCFLFWLFYWIKVIEHYLLVVGREVKQCLCSCMKNRCHMLNKLSRTFLIGLVPMLHHLRSIFSFFTRHLGLIF